MNIIKGIYALVVFLALRPYQMAQIQCEKILYRSKFFRAMAGFK